jgi:MinD-like ATPase involved in chromosome partitioning or flagellar assembly
MKNEIAVAEDKVTSQKTGADITTPANRISPLIASPKDKELTRDTPAPAPSRAHELNFLLGGTAKLELKKPRAVKSVAFISNKGGVGKTHISSNMAFYMARLGKQALLIDLDLGNADISNKLGFYCENTITDLLNGHKDPDKMIYDTPYGFHLIGGESGNLRLANLNPQQKRRLIRLFRETGREYDYVLYDLGAGITATTLDFALAQDYQVIVTTPQDIVAGFGCVKAAFQRFQDVEKTLADLDPAYRMRTQFRPLMIINQVPSFGTGKTLFAKLAEITKQALNTGTRFSVELNLLGMIAADSVRVREVEMARTLYSSKHGASHTGQCFHFLAHNLIEYRDPNSMEFTTKLKRFVTLFMKSVEETKFAQ